MFYPPKQFRNFTRILTGFCIFLLLVLGIVTTFPLYANYYQYIYQAELQNVREGMIVHSIMTLAYRSPQERTLAISRLQTTLPIFDQEQTTLLNDPVNDTHLLVEQTQPAYLAISRAAHVVVASENAPVDSTQVNIILAEDMPYRSTMGLVVDLLLQHAQNMVTDVFATEMGAIVVLLACIIFYTIITESRMEHVIEEEEKNTSGLP